MLMMNLHKIISVEEKAALTSGKTNSAAFKKAI